MKEIQKEISKISKILQANEKSLKNSVSGFLNEVVVSSYDINKLEDIVVDMEKSLRTVNDKRSLEILFGDIKKIYYSSVKKRNKLDKAFNSLEKEISNM